MSIQAYIMNKICLEQMRDAILDILDDYYHPSATLKHLRWPYASHIMPKSKKSFSLCEFSFCTIHIPKSYYRRKKSENIPFYSSTNSLTNTLHSAKLETQTTIIFSILTLHFFCNLYLLLEYNQGFSAILNCAVRLSPEL